MKARLISLSTRDGFVTANEKAYLGKVYTVHPETRRTVVLLNTDFEIHHTKEIIDVEPTEEGRHTGWFPTEMLEFIGNLT